MATAIHSHLTSSVEDTISSAANPAELSIVTTATPGAFLYRAGEDVPNPGSYWVWHHQHRSPHSAKVRFSTFPQCAQCGNNVRYLSMKDEPTAAEWLRRDPDFRHALTGRSRRKEPVSE